MDADAFLPAMTSAGLHLEHRPTPPENRVLSPYTGLDRNHWVACAHDLLDSAARYRSPHGARIDLPGRPSRQGVLVDGLEGFARTFLLAAILGVGDKGADSQRHLDRYVEGLRAGTSSGPEQWPTIGHVDGPGGQPQVEAASIALSLHLCRARTWDTLEASDQEQVLSWLRPILHVESSPNNWHLFALTVASFFESVGHADTHTQFAIDRGIGLIEDWYRGRGWYSDGDGEAYDHYIGWALHLYPLLHTHLRGDTSLAARLGPRLSEFLASFSRTFDRNGAPLYMGRSMTYRTATVAAVALGELSGHTPLTPGQSRRILSANLRYFFEHNARRDGVLIAGWHGSHEPTLQRYSGPGSPYWASKGFLALALPADHPVWTATEQTLPLDEHDTVDPIAPIGLMVQATARDGLVRVHNHGSDNIKLFDSDAGAPDPLYARFAYSTRTGPTALHNATDNDFQVRYRDRWSARRRIYTAAAGIDWIASWQRLHFPRYSPLPGSDTANHGSTPPSARIESVTLARGSYEVRIHRLRFAPRGCVVRMACWALAGERPEDLDIIVSPTHALVRDRAGLTSQVTALHGWHSAGTSPAPWGTAFGPWARVPELFSNSHENLFVASVALKGASGDGGGDDESHGNESGPRVIVEESRVSVDWQDGGDLSAVDLEKIPWGLPR